MSSTAQDQSTRQAALDAVVRRYPPEDYDFQIGNYLDEHDGALPSHLIVSEYHDGDHWLYLTDTPADLLQELLAGYEDHYWLPKLVFALDEGLAYRVGLGAAIGERAPRRGLGERAKEWSSGRPGMGRPGATVLL